MSFNMYINDQYRLQMQGKIRPSDGLAFVRWSIVLSNTQNQKKICNIHSLISKGYFAGFDCHAQLQHKKFNLSRQ